MKKEKRSWIKKGLAVVLSASMVLGIMPSLGEGTNEVNATERAVVNTAPTSEYWTDTDGLKAYTLDSESTATGKIKFGLNNDGDLVDDDTDDQPRKWYIAGLDKENRDTLALLSSSTFAYMITYGTNSKYSESNFIKDGGYFEKYLGSSNYFSSEEVALMADTTVSTIEPDLYDSKQTRDVTNQKLYLPDGSYNDTKIKVGAKNNIEIALERISDIDVMYNVFWLRSPGDYQYNKTLVGFTGGFLVHHDVEDTMTSTVPAFNLKLSSVLFASAADAASSSYIGVKTLGDMEANTYTLRYKPEDDDINWKNVGAFISTDGTSVKVDGANGKYLMVQNSDGAYAVAIDADTKTIKASDINIKGGDGNALMNFNNCKVWVESTVERITTAKLAEPEKEISTVALTDITAPVAGSELDTTAVCSTQNVTTTATAISWTPAGTNAAYNQVHTASVTISPASGYGFTNATTATVNENIATSVTRNEDGTLTVTYAFPKTDNKPLDSSTYFATREEMMQGYDLNGAASEPTGKIKFGANADASRLWAICGVDTDGTLALLSTSQFGTAAYGANSKYSESNFVNDISKYSDDDNGTTSKYLSDTYFSTSELTKMQPVAVKTLEPDQSGTREVNGSTVTSKLYLPDAANRKSYHATSIFVGTNNNISINLEVLNVTTAHDFFWLRSPYLTYNVLALAAILGNYVDYFYVDDDDVSVVPAFNLNLSSVLFASAVDAASASGATLQSNMEANTYTLRYAPEGSSWDAIGAVISADGTSVKADGANGKYLMVQNDEGAYAVAIDADTKTINASEINIKGGDGNALTNFNNCKVWVESTTERITTAKLATQDTAISAVEVTGITAPVAGTALDTTATYSTAEVGTVSAVTWTPDNENAAYNQAYTASITLTPTAGYGFTSATTAKVNGNTAASVTRNEDGTLMVTYTFEKTAKDKLTGITKPGNITVANGTAYEHMNLPATVGITTAGSTVSTALVQWNTTTPASGSYDSAVLTEQQVTLTGTVTCPDTINPNGVALTTTVTITISAADIVKAPTASVAGGTYQTNQNVVLFTTAEATIYYTTDGSEPSVEGGVAKGTTQQYSEAILVTGTEGASVDTTIKAIAVKSGMQNSAVQTFTYTIEIPDTTVPTGAIKVGTNNWTKFWNTVTFGQFFKNTKEVTITAADNVSATDKISIQYYLSDTELTETDAKNLADNKWTSYTGTFNLNQNNKKIIYAKLKDEKGNTSIINSSGIVVYTDSAAVTTSLTYIKNVTSDLTANVTLNGNTIKSIHDGTKTLTANTDYTVDANGKITFKNAYLSSLAVQKSAYTLTISYNPMGIVYQADMKDVAGQSGTAGQNDVAGQSEKEDQNEAPVTTSIALTVRKPKLTSITAPNAITNVANGTAKTAAALGLPTSVTISTEESSVTSASVIWDLDTLAEGTYNPAVLTKQTFKVNGTISLPNTIDADGITLATTIQVTVNAAPFVAAPTSSPATDVTYTSNQNVTLSTTTAEATIYYTTDGSVPSVEGGVAKGTTQQYTEAIQITGTEGTSVNTTIKAIAVKSGMQNSTVQTFTYTIAIPDTTAPTGTITIGTNHWTKFWNTVTFAQFFKNTKEVRITAEDNVSAANKISIQYYLSDTELTETAAKNLADSDWTTYTDKFSLDKNSKKIIYAKIKDEKNNISIINSSGIMVYTDSEAVTTTLTYVKNVSGDLTADVTLNGNTIKAINNGTKTLTLNTDYMVDANGKITFKNDYLSSLAVQATPYTLTISYNPMGEAYQTDMKTVAGQSELIDQNEAPATTSIALTVRNPKLTSITAPDAAQETVLPATGDNTPIWRYVWMFVIGSMVIMVGFGMMQYKKRKEESEN